ALAVGALQGRLGDWEAAAGKRGDRWEPLAIQLEQALWRGDAAEARRLLPDFHERFRREPLLYTPLNQGGHPRLILRAGIAQMILRGLVANLPRLGLLRETYELIRLAHDMEQEQPLEGPRVTEFDRVFQVGCQAVIEAAVDAATAQGSVDEDDLID